MSSYEEFDPEPKKAISYAELTSFQLYYNNWIKELEANHAEGPIPVFIISAEGGGIRAAYWTALILSFLQDKSEGLNLNTGDFARHIFAISGVSGGSLGAATFAGLLASRLSGEERSPTANAEVFAQDREGAAPLRNQAHCVLEKDFLAPTVGVMLFPDFFQRFVPWSFLNDRAVALETSWERAWDDCTNGNLKFSGPFELLWAGGRAYRVPLLFLNSTVVETGQRMITSPIPLEDASFKKAFSDALETTRTVGHNVSLSTVVHTSARFTYVSPAGTVYRLDLGDDSTEDDRLIRVVDGGYFENSGAVTASELLSVLETAAVDRSIREEVPRRPILPIIIHISNDPIQAPDKSLRVESKAGGFLPEVFSPVEALLNVRPARGYQARAALAERVQSAGSPRQEAPIDQAVQRPGIYVHFRLCEYEVPIPLGWTLSDRTRTELQAQLSDDLIGGADHPARPAVSGYHKVVISRIMNALEKGADLPVQERRTLDNYEQCKPQS